MSFVKADVWSTFKDSPVILAFRRVYFWVGNREIFNIIHLIAVGVILITLHSILPQSVLWQYALFAQIYFFFILASLILEITKGFYVNGKIDPKNKAILITGCDSGFGYELTKRLDSKGFTVFASCLDPEGEGAAQLKQHCSNNVKILGLDVAKDESVKHAVEFVKHNLEDAELWAVVNNAGIFNGTIIELTRMSDFKEIMEINTFGQVRVTKAFLSFLKESRGRVINMNSLLSRLSLPNLCTYTMSKFASLAFTECLRQEMEIWGIRVISIEPDLFQTPIVDSKLVANVIVNAMSEVDEQAKESYGEKYMKHLVDVGRQARKKASNKIHIVVDALESAITAKYPDSVYKPRSNIHMKILLYAVDYIPKRFIDICVRAVTRY